MIQTGWYVSLNDSTWVSYSKYEGEGKAETYLKDQFLISEAQDTWNFTSTLPDIFIACFLNIGVT